MAAERIDVLAVMDEAIQSYMDEGGDPSDLRAARTAVAELTWAASHAAEWIEEVHNRYGFPNAITISNLRAALARMGEGA